VIRRVFLFSLLLAGIGFWLPRLIHSESATWRTISPGVEMRVFTTSPQTGSVRVIALRANPSHIHVATGGTHDAPEWRRKTRAVMAVNGGFFDTEGKSLGLRIARGKRVSRLRKADWGVFYVRAGKARIAHTSTFKLRNDITEAVQCGPRLVADGRIIKLKDQWARRTALGVEPSGKVIVAITDGELGFREWAALWASRSGFNCQNAMGLDGGGSTQMSVRTSSQSLEVGGYTKVPDAVVIR
jgi:uncharacterized protein YigE (DUF2233 family)